MKRGIAVHCTHCGRMKKPIGRSAPVNWTPYCDHDCPGYVQPPLAGHLWPGETEEQLGHKVGPHGVEEV